MVHNSKFVKKFNQLLLMFLQDLLIALPGNKHIETAVEFVTALFILQPDTVECATHFMESLQGCSDFLLTSNTDVFSKAKEYSSVVSKKEILSIYKELDSESKTQLWKYLNKLYSVGVKALPDMQQHSEFNFDSLSTNSPIKHLMKTVKGTELVVKDTRESQEEEGMVVDALRSVALNFVGTVRAATDNEQLQASCDISSTNLQSCSTDDIIRAFEMDYDATTASGLVTDTENTLLEYGLPLIGGGPEVAKAAINSDVVSSALQLGTLYITLTQLDPKMVKKMELLAHKFSAEIKNGGIEIGDVKDPMQLMATLASSSLGDEIIAMLSSM